MFGPSISWACAVEPRRALRQREVKTRYLAGEIGIGFAGTCDAKGGILEGTAVAGKRSIRFEARLELICAAQGH